MPVPTRPADSRRGGRCKEPGGGRDEAASGAREGGGDRVRRCGPRRRVAAGGGRERCRRLDAAVAGAGGPDRHRGQRHGGEPRRGAGRDRVVPGRRARGCRGAPGRHDRRHRPDRSRRRHDRGARHRALPRALRRGQAVRHAQRRRRGLVPRRAGPVPRRADRQGARQPHRQGPRGDGRARAQPALLGGRAGRARPEARRLRGRLVGQGRPGPTGWRPDQAAGLPGAAAGGAGPALLLQPVDRPLAGRRRGADRREGRCRSGSTRPGRRSSPARAR